MGLVVGTRGQRGGRWRASPAGSACGICEPSLSVCASSFAPTRAARAAPSCPPSQPPLTPRHFRGRASLTTLAPLLLALLAALAPLQRASAVQSSSSEEQVFSAATVLASQSVGNIAYGDSTRAQQSCATSVVQQLQSSTLKTLLNTPVALSDDTCAACGSAGVCPTGEHKWQTVHSQRMVPCVAGGGSTELMTYCTVKVGPGVYAIVIVIPLVAFGLTLCCLVPRCPLYRVRQRIRQHRRGGVHPVAEVADKGAAPGAAVSAAADQPPRSAPPVKADEEAPPADS